MRYRPTSSPLRWDDLRAAKVGVWGVGTEGKATLSRLAELELVPAAVVDDRPADSSVLQTDRGGIEALARCEVVIKSPGISRYSAEVRHLEDNGVAVVGGLGLWLETVGTERVIGITGTKGKSTTTSITSHLARSLGMNVFAGGNLGTVPWDPASPPAGDLWVIEVSSYQATDLWSSPAVVAVTSLHPDHLNWHGSVERYYEDKLSLCGRRGSLITVANGADERLRQRSEQLRPGPIWVAAQGAPPDWVGALGLRGSHNVTNALVAAECLAQAGVPDARNLVRLAEAARGYEPLPSRLSTIATIAGVEYVDDSLSTNVLPTIAAVDVFEDRPLALIVGGYDRNIDYTPLAVRIARRSAPTLVLTIPENGPRISKAVAEHGCPVEDSASIAEAVATATAWAEPGAVVLLSPAAASYGIYRNFAARAEAFSEAVAAIG